MVFSDKPIPGFENVSIKKVDINTFYKYCRKAGIREDIIKEIYKISKGYIENARYYIRIVKRFDIKDVREFRKFFRKKFDRKIFIYISFFSSTMKYFFYAIGNFQMGNVFGAISYVMMILYFICQEVKFKNMTR